VVLGDSRSTRDKQLRSKHR